MTIPNNIVCVRHGETVWKTEGRTQGQLDSPLTDTGIRQVHQLADVLKGQRFEAIVSSTLGRAVQTAEILAGELRLSDVRPSAYLIERGEGVLQGLTRAEQMERFPDCFDKATGQVIADKIPDGELTDDFLARVAKGLHETQSLAKMSNVLMVTHTGVLQALTSLVFAEDFVAVSSKRSFGFCDILRLN